VVDGEALNLRQRAATSGYAELHAHSSYSLLDGVPSPEALAKRTAEVGMRALALTDHDALYGAVPFTQAAQAAAIKPILGAEITLVHDDPILGEGMNAHLTLLVETAQGYANLCRLITRARRGEIPRLLLARKFKRALEVARGYARLFGPGHFFIELQRHNRQGDDRLLAELIALAARADLDIVATGNAHYLFPQQREVHDVLTCIREHTTLEEAGGLLRSNDDYWLRSPEEMAALFREIPIALENTCQIAERCAPAYEYLPGGAQVLPRFPVPGGEDSIGHLRALCTRAMALHYPEAQPRAQLERELAVIDELKMADYFLIVWDIVRYARKIGVRCQGRGSAANSLVAYLLGITPIDPVAYDLVFERFLSLERGSPPDIDIDFAADRREEVIQYVYERYGEEHTAMACTMVTFRARSAVRDVARVLGFPPPLVERLAGALDVRDVESVEESRGLVETFGEQLAGKPFQHLLRLVPQLDGIPRHLGIHNGGMVIAGPPLCKVVPLEPATMPGRVVTQWDKDGLEGAGLIKIDLLGLRMLAAIEDAVTIVEAQTGKRPDLKALVPNDPRVYDMLCQGGTVGVFQVESRAQSSLIPRFQPRTFEDLVIEISLIRPGPIQAQMVHPYLRRRDGLDPITYLHPLMEPALAETLGVMVFQEQVLKVARDLAGFTPGRADLLRRALSHKRAGEMVARFREEFISGAVAKGASQEVADLAFEQLQAFGGYAFPKSHAAAFALLTYQSAWLRCYHPAAFFAGLLRNQPMGFYPPHIVVSEARRCGVTVEPVDVCNSHWGATVDGDVLRLGLASVSGLGKLSAQNIVDARRFEPFRSLVDFCGRTKLGRWAVESLIWAGAFDRWRAPRRQLIWNLEAALRAAEGPPKLRLPGPADRPQFAFLSSRGRLWTEIAHTGVAASAHLMSLVDDRLREFGVISSQSLAKQKNGRLVWVGGVVASAQRPPTAKGTAFLALEDEDGMINVVLRSEVYEGHQKALKAPFVAVQGRVQWRDRALSVVAQKVVPLHISFDE